MTSTTTPRPKRARPTATPLTLAGAVVAGVGFDLIVRERVGIGAAAFPILVAGLLVATRALINRDGRWLVAPVLAIAPWVAVRTNVATVAIDLVVVWALIIGAAGIGRRQRLLSMAFDGWERTLAMLAESLVTVFPFVGRAIARIAGPPGWSPARRSVAKGLLIALPGLVTVVALLASADAAFASLFAWWSGNQVAHVLVAAGGTLGFAALALVAGRDEPAVALSVRRSIGAVEAITIVGPYVAVYTAFVASRMLAVPSRATAQQISDAARAGFFQLVAVGAITLGMLVWVRARAAMTRTLRMLIIAAAGLTVTIVVVALHRLGVYRSTYGLTPLRLGTTFFSWWLGLLFVLIAASTVVHVGRRRWAVAVLVSAIGWLVAWNAINTDAVIAATNIGRVPLAEDAGWSLDSRDAYDAELTIRLSADAIPTVVDRFDDIPAEQQQVVREWLCGSGHRRHTGLAWTLGNARADAALAQFCGKNW